MFVAWRDLRFAKGRFALMATVIVLITLLVGLLSGLTAGLGQQNISAITGLPADQIAFQAPSGGQKLSYSNSTVTEEQWRTLRDALQREADKWRKGVDVRTSWDGVSASAALSTAAHTAYHLGAIRQILAEVSPRE